jgi:hypothetical protein
MSEDEEFALQVEEQYLKYFGAQGWKPEYKQQFSAAFRNLRDDD